MLHLLTSLNQLFLRNCMNSWVCADFCSCDISQTAAILDIFIQCGHHANDSGDCISGSTYIDNVYIVAINSASDTFAIGVHDPTFTFCDHTPPAYVYMPSG